MNPTPEMNETLQELIDHHEIRKLLSVYCHGCDRGDEYRMAGVYREDAWDDHGSYKGPAREFAKFVMNAFATRRELLKGVHLLGQSLIRVIGNAAGAETYFIASSVVATEGGRKVVNLLSGRYVDNLVRENGQWRISKRVCVRDWSISLNVEKDWLENGNFVEGEMSGKDPSYAILGLEHPGLPLGS